MVHGQEKSPALQWAGLSGLQHVGDTIGQALFA